METSGSGGLREQTINDTRLVFIDDADSSTKTFFETHALDITHRYTKPEMIKLGWVFYNRVGSGQVPIIKQIDGENTRMDALLTKEQLERHKKESLPEGLKEEDLPLIESDMNEFMHRVQLLTYASESLGPRNRGVSRMRNYLGAFIRDVKGISPELAEKVERKLRETNFYGSKTPLVIVDTAIQSVSEKHKIPDNVRGIPVGNLDRRGEGSGVFGYPCPCMDCEYIFPRTDGIKIFDTDGSITGTKGQIRMNVITNHLAGHGINNNENQTVDRDHRYMTLREYLPIYEKRYLDEKSRVPSFVEIKQIQKEILLKVLTEVRNKLDLESEISDRELDRTASKYLFIPVSEDGEEELVL